MLHSSTKSQKIVKCRTMPPSASLVSVTLRDSGICKANGIADGGGGLLRPGGRKMALLVFFCFLLFLQAASDGCRLKMKPKRDQNVTIASSLNITCSLRKKFVERCTDFNISMYHNGKNLFQSSGERSISVIANFTSEKNRGDYKCELSTSCCRQQLADEKSINIQVGYKPEQYNMSQAEIVFENQQNLRIFFNVTAPGPDDKMIKPQWTAFVKDNITCQQYRHHGLTTHFLCQQHLYDERFTNRTISITGESMKETVSRNYSIAPYLIVKPSVVDEVEVVPGVRQMNMTWNAIVGIPPLLKKEVGGLTHSLTYQSQFDLQPRTMEGIHCDESKCRAVLNGLVPHAWYNLSISCKPNRGGFSSDPFITQVQTLTDIPARGPGLPPWSFSWAEGSPDVTIYPAAIPDDGTRGGDIKEYLVYLCNASKMVHQSQGNSSCHSRVTPDMFLLQTAPASHFLRVRVPNLTSRENVHLAVFATTSAGCSQNASHLYIPAALETQGRGWVDAEQTNSTEFQVWFEPQNSCSCVAEEVRLHWCCPYYSFDSSQPPACKGELFTQKLGSVSGLLRTDVTVNQSCDTSPRFGISSTGNKISSGIIWNSCLYDRHKGLSGVVVDNADYDDKVMAIVVSWSMGCADKARPLSYNLAFVDLGNSPNSSSELCDEARMVTVNASHRGMTQRKTVSSGSSYAICLRENAEEQGPWKTIRRDIPNGDHGSKAYIIAGSIVTLLIAIAIVLGVYCLCCKKQQVIQTEKCIIIFPDGALKRNSIYTSREFFNDSFQIKPVFPIQETEIKVPNEDTDLLVGKEEEQVDDSGCSEERDPQNDYGWLVGDTQSSQMEEDDSGRPNDSCGSSHEASDQNET